MTILVISHTEHYISEDNSIVGWGPTVRELDYVAAEFGNVIHIACLHKKKAPPSAIPYSSNKVKYIAIPPSGGPRIMNKLKIVFTAPFIIYTVFKQLKKADAFQFRAPTGMGVYLIPLLTFFTGKKGWFKYAGNWNQQKPPFSYAFQRWWLKNLQRRPVTINGFWPQQPTHLKSFENPCLSESDRINGEIISSNRLFHAPFDFCFVGRLESAKGVEDILQALEKLPVGTIHCVHWVGDGPLREKVETWSKAMHFENDIHGFLSRQPLFEIYKKSHFILLPSKAEGFPKVVAEAGNFGCIPVVSAISSIPHYISDGKNGFLWYKNQMSFTELLYSIFCKSNDFNTMSKMIFEEMRNFTYESYIDKLKKILH